MMNASQVRKLIIDCEKSTSNTFIIYWTRVCHPSYKCKVIQTSLFFSFKFQWSVRISGWQCVYFSLHMTKDRNEIPTLVPSESLFVKISTITRYWRPDFQTFCYSFIIEAILTAYVERLTRIIPRNIRRTQKEDILLSPLPKKPTPTNKNPKSNVTTHKRNQKLRLHNVCGPV